MGFFCLFLCCFFFFKQDKTLNKKCVSTKKSEVLFACKCSHFHLDIQWSNQCHDSSPKIIFSGLISRMEKIVFLMVSATQKLPGRLSQAHTAPIMVFQPYWYFCKHLGSCQIHKSSMLSQLCPGQAVEKFDASHKELLCVGYAWISNHLVMV